VIDNIKLYSCKTAPSPLRARIFIAEKGLAIEEVEIDLGGGEHLGDAFNAINPRCTVPVLAVGNHYISENIAIASWLEETFPEPPLMGSNAMERARVLEANAWVEYDGFIAIQAAFRNKAKGLKGRATTGSANIEQIPALVERGMQQGSLFIEALDQRLQNQEYVAGDFLSFADISAWVMLSFAQWVKLPIPEEATALKAWQEKLNDRPAFQI
jgi:glutathione S-transferase